MAGFVQQGVHRRIVTNVYVRADDSGLRLAPERSGDRSASLDEDQAQAKAQQQCLGHLDAQVTDGQYASGDGRVVQMLDS